MRLRLLIDMNLSPAWVSLLTQAGIEAVHWSSVGPGNAPDETLFAWARENGYMIFTHDLDFGAMLSATRAEAPSVFQIRTEDVSPEALGERAVELLKRLSPHLEQGALVIVDELRERIRVLPIGRG
jgi:predicted nuclease of predicted toxin-antitoxin system